MDSRNRGQNLNEKRLEVHCCTSKCEILYSCSNFSGLNLFTLVWLKKETFLNVYMTLHPTTSKPDAGGTHLFLIILLQNRISLQSMMLIYNTLLGSMHMKYSQSTANLTHQNRKQYTFSLE